MFWKHKGHQTSNILVLGLASWRLSHALVNEVGPFRIFSRIRKLAGITNDDDGYPLSWSGDNLLSCVWCTSFWVTILLYLAPVQLRYFFAGSAIAVLLEEYVTKDG